MLIYKWTKHLRDVHLMPGHAKLEGTAWALAVKVDDALEISEETEI